MSDDLKVLQDHRDALLLAEVAAWLHDMGKCTDEHIVNQASDKPESYLYKYKTAQSHRLPSGLSVSLLEENISVKQLIEKGMPRIISKASRPWLLRALGRCHSVAHVEKELSDKETSTKQPKDDTRLSSAFGCEGTPITGLTSILSALPFNSIYNRSTFVPQVESAFDAALGDTRRPVNEVTLADWSGAVAALYKSALAGALLRVKPNSPDDLRWRLLRINFDVLALYTKAIKIADLLAYRNAANQACQRVKALVEEEYPLGNEVYRDTTGIYFTFPDLDPPADLAQEIRRRVEKVEPELAPRIAVVPGEGANAQEQLKGILGKAHGMAVEALKQPFDADNLPSDWQQEWEKARNDERKWEVCPVCGLRPKEESAEVCTHCENRRKSRPDAWLKAPAQTIWLGEIADHNDRVALLVGKFGLDDWFSGNLVQTMLVKAVENDPGKCVSKNPSPARLRRVWETCQRFWEQTVQQEILSAKLGRRGIRKHIIPDKMNWQPGLYNGKVNSKPIDLFWQPEHNAFLTINNLQAAGAFKQGDLITLKRPESKREYEFRIQDIRQTPTRLEQYHPFLPLLASPDQFLAFVPAADALDIAQKIRSEYETQFGKVRNRLPLHLGVVYFERKMPLMAVMDTARQMLNRSSSPEIWQVKSKTDLNLTDGGWPSDVQLTLIRDSANIQMTVRTVMGDGRTPDEWYPYWRVEGKPTDRYRWFIGPDGEYWVHVTKLEPGDRVQFTPSTFDFLWLDAAARRFELAYDKDGRRPSRPTKPYYLEDLDRLDPVWQVFSQLSRTQIKQILQTIETARERWNIPLGTQAESDEVFKQFVTDTLANAQWSKDCSWKSLGIASPPGLNTGEKNARPTRPTAARNDMQTKLTTAAVRGELTDLAELHLSILKEKPEEKE